MWAHQKLDVFHKAMDAAELIDAYARQIPSARADLRDELRRASSSMLLNTAEGADEFASSEKARFYRMARRSAGECSTVIELCGRILRPRIPDEEIQRLLADVGSMLTAMIKRHADK